MSSLDMSASFHGWVCSNCHQLYDAMWKPIPIDKAWAPPVQYMWVEDKPTFNFCSTCGERFEKEPDYGDEIRS